MQAGQWLGWIFLVIIVGLIPIVGMLLFIAWLGEDVDDYDDSN